MVANAVDPVLQSVPAERRPTLLAERVKTPSGIAYRFDVHRGGARPYEERDVAHPNEVGFRSEAPVRLVSEGENDPEAKRQQQSFVSDILSALDHHDMTAYGGNGPGRHVCKATSALARYDDDVTKFFAAQNVAVEPRLERARDN